MKNAKRKARENHELELQKIRQAETTRARSMSERLAAENIGRRRIADDIISEIPGALKRLESRDYPGVRLVKVGSIRKWIPPTWNFHTKVRSEAGWLLWSTTGTSLQMCNRDDSGGREVVQTTSFYLLDTGKLAFAYADEDPVMVFDPWVLLQKRSDPKMQDHRYNLGQVRDAIRRLSR